MFSDWKILTDLPSLQSYLGWSFKLDCNRCSSTLFIRGVAPWQRDVVLITVAFAFIILILHSSPHTDVAVMVMPWLDALTYFRWSVPQFGFVLGLKAQRCHCPNTLSHEWVGLAVDSRCLSCDITGPNVHPCVSKCNDATLRISPGVGHAPRDEGPLG